MPNLLSATYDRMNWANDVDSHLAFQLFDKQWPAPVDDGAVIRWRKRGDRLPDRRFGIIGATPTTIQRIAKTGSTIFTVLIKEIHHRRELGHAFVEPRLIELVVADQAVKPLVCHLVGRRRLEITGRVGRVLEIVHANRIGNDARIFDTERVGRRADEVEFGERIRAVARVEALHSVGGNLQHLRIGSSEFGEGVAVDRRFADLCGNRHEVAAGRDVEIAHRPCGVGDGLAVVGCVSADFDP